MDKNTEYMILFVMGSERYYPATAYEQNQAQRNVLMMGYTLFSIKCPDCGKPLDFEEGKRKCTCPYCSANVILKNDCEYVIRHIDVAKIQKNDNDRILRLKELQIEEKRVTLRKTLTLIWLAMSLVLIIIGLIIMLTTESTETAPGWFNGIWFLLFVSAPIIIGSAYLVFILIPEKENEKAIAHQGGIRFPKELAPFSEKKYKTIQDSLRAVGFTNVSCVNLQDLNMFTNIVNGDKVDAVKVNGKTITSGGKMYLPNVPIVITYHGR